MNPLRLVTAAITTAALSVWFIGCGSEAALVTVSDSTDYIVEESSTIKESSTAEGLSAETSLSRDGFVFDHLPTRESRRAFYTAPPVIPHEVGDGDRECLTCHLQEKKFAGRLAMATPHPELKNCQQCHVRGASPEFMGSKQLSVETDWIGLKEPTEGHRAHAFAPPMVPHREFLRESCLTCHSASHPNENMRLDHPERVNCQQCHVQDKAKTEIIVP